MINEADRINQALTDEARDGLKTVISLDGFLALKGEARAARWRQMDRAGKFQLVAQQIERLGYDWMPSDVEAQIAKYDEKWENGQRESDLVIPPAAEILAVVSDSIVDARRHDDMQGVRQLDRIRANIVRGARLTWVLGDLLIQSVNNPGVVYSVNRSGCSCPNGTAGRSQCWHVALFDLLLDMLDRDAETADMEAEPTPAELGQRLCAARQRLYSEAA